MSDHYMSSVTDQLYLSEAQATMLAPHAGCDASRNLALLMRMSCTAVREAETPELHASLDGIISPSVLRNLLSGLHHRDINTMRHSRRVALLAVGLAEYLGWEGHALKLLEVAGLLHEIGKIGVPDHILFKPGRLSPDELELIALHYNMGLDVLQACRVDRSLLELLSQAQARYGGGDPLKQMGRETQLGARILAVAAAYESMSAVRADRPARTHESILEVLRKEGGTQFDANVVAALERYIARHGLPYSSDGSDFDAVQICSPAGPQQMLEANSLCHVFNHLYVLESLYDGFAIFDADLRVLVWNRSLQNLTGHPSTQVLGSRWSSGLLKYSDLNGEPLNETDCPMHRVVQGGGPVVCDVQLNRADGRTLSVELQALPIHDDTGQLLGVVEIYRDLTRSGHRRPQELRELKLAATRDALTAVANRGELETQLTVHLNEFQKDPESPFSLIFADADFFKSINDTYGHTVGDQVLIDIAQTLQRETYCGELVARYGGEEFVILCPDTTLEQAERRAERLRLAIRSCPMGGNSRLRVTASFGATEVETGDSMESILRRADKALYNAKNTGRDKTCVLTNEQILASENEAEAAKELEGPMISNVWFSAVVAADMVIYKLGGYVEDYGAKLLEVTADHVLLQQGRSTLFGFWGNTSESQPVEIRVQFSNPLGAQARKGRNTAKVSIGLKIRPLGWCRSREAFNQRVRRITREIKHYFAAD
ncbi:diguanylate cyclase [bacterium]|nr:diguanylate cyclase [bacterium]